MDTHWLLMDNHIVVVEHSLAEDTLVVQLAAQMDNPEQQEVGRLVFRLVAVGRMIVLKELMRRHRSRARLRIGL